MARPISRSSAAISRCPGTRRRFATLRKNVAVLWVPPEAKVKGKKAAPKITKVAQLTGHRIGVVGRTQANVNLLKVILQQYGVDPGKVEIVQFPANEAVEAIRKQKADAYLAAGPVNSKITPTRSRRQPATAAVRSSLRSIWRTRSRRNHPMYEASEIPAGSFGNDRPDDDGQDDQLRASHRGAKGPVGIDGCRLHPAIIRDPAIAEERIPAGGEDRDPDTDKDATIPVHPGAAAFVDGDERPSSIVTAISSGGA